MLCSNIGVDWINLAYDVIHCRAAVNTVLNVLFYKQREISVCFKIVVGWINLAYDVIHCLAVVDTVLNLLFV